MGQQQLLLVVVGLIIVGLAVGVGITMFADDAISSNRDAVTNDLVNLASRARQYYHKPTALGGGGSSFVGLSADAAGLQKLTSKPQNLNGTYSIKTAGTDSTVYLLGVGTEKAGDGNLVQITMLVKPDSAIAAVDH